MLLNSLTLWRIKAELDRTVHLETSNVTFDNGTLTVYGNGVVIRDQVSEHQADTNKIVITGDVSTIDEHTFENFSNLQTVSIDHSINISNFAFHSCTLLESISFSSNIVSLGTNVFEDCSNLKLVDFPGSLSSIPAFTFKNCVFLEKVVVETPERTFQIGESAFYGCSNLFTFTALSENVTIGKNAFNGCTILQDFIIGAIISYEEGVFANSELLKLYSKDTISFLQNPFLIIVLHYLLSVLEEQSKKYNLTHSKAVQILVTSSLTKLYKKISISENQLFTDVQIYRSSML
ncbi:hypothetical protein TVAG_459570 [Trichomonas vaginalis G3]|uniref:Surface antigen BspA-like n=1 Tax=Trichomonas vaginalis (strain ATCC PRA-98 / G3) TaxID=412133 RepID=A2FHL7_TRIV3|nr:ribonuclease inhibitor domain-containing protein [Trichomonas vaginalis G3]EAX95608.1 hypothetical protein TVAG_459570 [Trichomonas vaginalis G3]KAI5511935.1 ribonuclease inhibitor domain-containing protein [Trichomonas vaginalis G3]|eukprot:XP_001308538.1 hypothetical protein [Trichomonas vaginalis G3]